MKLVLMLLLSLVVAEHAPAAQALGSQANTQVATIQRVTVNANYDSIVVEIDASQPVAPQAQLLIRPDRIVVDLPNAVPGKQVRDIPFRGALRAVRVGLFTAKPPVTRVVLDLKIPQKFEVATVGNRVIVKVSLASRVGKQ